MKGKILFLCITFSSFVFSCVSPKKLEQAEAKYTQLNGAYLELKNKDRELEGELKGSKLQNEETSNQLAKQKAESDERIKDLNSQIDYLKQNPKLLVEMIP